MTRRETRVADSPQPRQSNRMRAEGQNLTNVLRHVAGSPRVDLESADRPDSLDSDRGFMVPLRWWLRRGLRDAVYPQHGGMLGGRVLPAAWGQVPAYFAALTGRKGE